MKRGDYMIHVYVE
jgi:hypothetical protein